MVLQEHRPGTPLYTPSRWYTPGKFWYTLGCTIHPVDKHCYNVMVSFAFFVLYVILLIVSCYW